MARLLALVVSVALLTAACGSGGDDDAADTSTTTSSSTSTTAAPETVAPTTEAAPPTSPPTTVSAPTAPDTTTSTTTAPAATVPLPDLTTVVDEVGLGDGVVVGAAPAPGVVWVGAPSEGEEVLGCEGLPADALWAQQTDGEGRTPALPDDPDLVGVTEAVATADGRVLLVRACEGFLVDAWVGTPDGAGVIGDVTALDLPESTLFPTIRLTGERVTYVEADPFGTTGGTLRELDLASGTTNTLVDGDVWNGVGLASGSLMYRTSTELFVDGFSLGSFPTTGPFAFTFAPDPTAENVAVSVTDGLAVYLGAVDELVPVLGEDVAVLDWHPSGQALLVNGPVADEPVPPRVVLLDGTEIPLPSTDVIDGVFSADGRAVVVTTFDDAGTITSTAFTFAA